MNLNWRWVTRVLARYDAEKRPRLTAWIWIVIVGVMVLFGLLGYAVPALLTRVL